ncbi:MAG: hypothetical protein ACRDN6_15355, partial [Gaiellaceae bacterium]
MRRLALLAFCVAALAAPAAAHTHPLGNFTVNRFAAVELAGDAVYVRYALDLAEIPTYQQRRALTRPALATKVGRGLVLRLDGRRAPLVLVDSRLRFF